MNDWTPLGAQFLFCASQRKFQATIGQFQSLKTIEHPYLAQYVDLQRGVNDRLFVISQQPHTRLAELTERHLAQLIIALDYLNRQGLMHHALCPSALGQFHHELLLSDWGLYHMTDRGRTVMFPVPDLRYVAPEFVASLSGDNYSFNPRADVWSVGMLLLEQKLKRHILNDTDISAALTQLRALELKLVDTDFLDSLLAAESEDCRDFIRSCLIFDPLQRPAPSHLLNHPYIARIVELVTPDLTPNSIRSFTRVPRPFHSDKVTASNIQSKVNHGIQLNPICTLTPTEADPLNSLPLSYLYYLWRLTGGSLETELGRMKSVPMPLPSVERIPRVIKSAKRDGGGDNQERRHLNVSQGINGGEWVELGDRRGILFDPQVCIRIYLDRLRRKLVDFYAEAETDIASNTPPSIRYPLKTMTADDLIFFQSESEVIIPPRYSLPPVNGSGGDEAAEFGEDKTTTDLNYPAVTDESVNALPLYHLFKARLTSFTRLPLIIREQDSVYQYHRLLLFHQLLQTFPASHKELIKQSRIDIPPPVRGKVWACLLGVRGDYESEYYRIDKETEHDVDRQLEVDIPRCHQYHPLLNNPTGHEKLRRILKAWCLKNPNLVYWQGLDSLCAPFLVNNFNDEPLAFACLQRLIQNYLKNFFLHDNSAILQDHLAAFRQLITFHDPQLNQHLTLIGFQPSLYAIPWFLTIFTHVLPIHKINILWDVLFTLPVEPTFPLFIGLAILQKLRFALLNAEFNDCIALFQEICDMDISRIMEDAWIIRQRTPNSIVNDVGLAPMERMATLGRRSLERIPSTHNHVITDQETAKNLSANNKGLGMEELNRALCTYESDDGGDESVGPLSPYEHSLRWWNRPTPAEVRLNEAAPRLSLDDLMRMDERACVIDLRPREEFKSGHYPHSIGVNPVDAEFFASVLNLQLYRYFIIIADRGDSGPKFAEQLADSNVPHVAALNGGIDAIRTTSNSTVQLCSCQTAIESFGPNQTEFWRCST